MSITINVATVFPGDTVARMLAIGIYTFGKGMLSQWGAEILNEDTLLNA